MLLYYGMVSYLLKSMYSELIIATEVPVTTEWRDLSPGAPLALSKERNGIDLVVEESLMPSGFGDKTIQLSDGTVIHPEVQLVDKTGHVTNVDLFTHPSAKHTIHGNVGSGNKGVSYTRVRVRCDRPLHARRVIWTGADYK
jgi:hypothetical protein